LRKEKSPYENYVRGKNRHRNRKLQSFSPESGVFEEFMRRIRAGG
jgi:hypothetical protein